MRIIDKRTNSPTMGMMIEEEEANKPIETAPVDTLQPYIMKGGTLVPNPDSPEGQRMIAEANPPKTADEVPDTPDVTGDAAPGDDTTGDDVSPANQAQIDAADYYTKQANDLKDKFDSYTQDIADIDAELSPTITNIKSIFDRRIEEMTIKNKALQGQTGLANVRTGLARYAPQMAAGLVSKETTAGINRIGDLESQKLTAIENAKQALKSNAKDKWSVFSEYMEQTDKYYELKKQAILDLATQLRDEEKAISEKAQADIDTQQKQANLIKTQQEIAKTNIDSYSSMFVDFDEAGNVNIADSADIQAFADESRIPYAQLFDAIRQKAFELSKLSSEDRLRELNIAKVQRDLLGATTAEWQQAVENGWTTTKTPLEYLAEKKKAEKGTDEDKFSELTPEQKSEGNFLAKTLYGSSAIKTEHGYNMLVNPILERMVGGESIDDISDDLRFKGQSPEFTGTIRDAAQQITSKLSPAKSDAVFDKLDDLLAKNDISKVRDYIKKIAVENAAGGIEQAKMITGQERTVEFLEEIANDLKTLEDNGINTNIFTGNIEKIAKNVGTVNDAEMRKIATKIMKARQQYRRSMTGVAFSPGENAEYDAIFPSIDKTESFNTATVDALKEAFRGDVDFFYSFQMGHDAYQELFKDEIIAEYTDAVDFAGRATQEELNGFNALKTTFPDKTPQEIFEFYQEEQDLSRVGGDTNLATKAGEVEEGTKGGQCGKFVNKLTGLGVGDTFASKMAKMDKSITEPKAGMVFVIPYKDTGHCGIILSIDNGIATVKDSNYSLDEKVKIHQIPVSKMTGFTYA